MPLSRLIRCFVNLSTLCVGTLSPLLHPETLTNGCVQFTSPLFVVTFPFHMLQGLALNNPPNEFKQYAWMHPIVIIVMLTLFYFIMTHGALIIYLYHISMLTLHTSLISRILWLPQA